MVWWRGGSFRKACSTLTLGSAEDMRLIVDGTSTSDDAILERIPGCVTWAAAMPVDAVSDDGAHYASLAALHLVQMLWCKHLVGVCWSLYVLCSVVDDASNCTQQCCVLPVVVALSVTV